MVKNGFYSTDALGQQYLRGYLMGSFQCHQTWLGNPRTKWRFRENHPTTGWIFQHAKGWIHRRVDSEIGVELEIDIIDISCDSIDCNRIVKLVCGHYTKNCSRY